MPDRRSWIADVVALAVAAPVLITPSFAQTPPTASTAAPITRAQFQKVLQQLDLRGADFPMRGDLSVLLGLALENGKGPNLRKYTIEDAQKNQHCLYRLKDGNGYLIFWSNSETQQSDSYFFDILIDNNLSPLKGVIQYKGQAVRLISDPEELRSDVREELAVWADYSNYIK